MKISMNSVATGVVSALIAAAIINYVAPRIFKSEGQSSAP